MPALTQAQAKSALCDAVVAITGLSSSNVYRDEIDGHRPDTNHVQVLEIIDEASGFARRYNDTQLEQTRRMTCRLDAYGQTAVDALQKLALSLISDDPGALALYAAGVSVWEVGGVQNVSAILHSHHEPRAALTVGIAYVRQVSSVGTTAATTVVVDVETAGGATVDQDAVISETIP